MATKTFTTKSGKTGKVELVRDVQDRIAYADGYNIVTGREIIEYTNFKLLDEAGKVIAHSHHINMLRTDKPTEMAMIKKGAVARMGTAYIPQAVVNQINAALAELDAENPKSEEYLAIKQAQAEAQARWEADLPAMMEAEAFEREMSRADSDL